MSRLRVRMTLLATAVTAVVLVLAGAALLTVLVEELTESGDGASTARVSELLDLAESGDLPEVIDPGTDDGVAQVIGSNGQVLAASANIEGEPALLDPISTDGELRVTTRTGPDDEETEEYRLWYASASSSDPTIAVVGRSLESVDEAAMTVRRIVMFGVPAVLLVLAALVWWVVGRALGRMDAITDTVARIGPDDLERRVPETGTDDEVGRLARTMNTMLGRLEASAQRQRSFVADASHDLQSPLTGVRTELEVALARPEAVEVTPLARRLLSANAEMELLVADLLALAVEDETRDLRAPELLDLDQLVLEEAARARPATEVVLDTSAVSAAPVRGDAPALRRLVRNLVDNAVRHAHTRVDLSLAQAGARVVLDVVDDGDGVAPVDRERIFDRFYRADAARSPGAPRGSGLGLAIVRQVAARHGGEATLVPHRGGAHFRITLPIAD